MTPTGDKTFVGFGFGPIQSGLFLLEAFRSGNFSRLVVAEVDAELVAAVRDASNTYTVNIAHHDRIEPIRVQGVELLNPREPGDRAELLAALAEADELATALPSVDFYDTGGEASVAALIAEGLKTGDRERPVIAYAAENNNHAAAALTAAVSRHVPDGHLDGLQTLDTVIGKMSGVVDDASDPARLAPLTAAGGRSVRVEAFNRILVSRVTPPAARGITAFIEKDDLLPFEEAKLYGHNAIHALMGYLARHRGLSTMAQAAGDEWIMSVARAAFLEESRPAMLHRHGGLDDSLFTPDGYQAYAEDLLQRMVCPFLNDRVARVTRDPQRKLDYGDRLYGTMRLALDAGVEPANLALGAAAGAAARAGSDSPEAIETCLAGIWGDRTDGHRQKLVDLTIAAVAGLPSTG